MLTTKFEWLYALLWLVIVSFAFLKFLDLPLGGVDLTFVWSSSHLVMAALLLMHCVSAGYPADAGIAAVTMGSSVVIIIDNLFNIELGPTVSITLYGTGSGAAFWLLSRIRGRAVEEEDDDHFEDEEDEEDESSRTLAQEKSGITLHLDDSTDTEPQQLSEEDAMRVIRKSYTDEAMQKQRWNELQRGEPVFVRAGKLVRATD